MVARLNSVGLLFRRGVRLMLSAGRVVRPCWIPSSRSASEAAF